LDVQIAAGLIGREYPAGYGSLVSGILGVRTDKGETRTDWRRRPLTDRQVGYALEDVRHLKPLRDRIVARLEQLGRMDWLDAEMAAWQADVIAARGDERWRRVSGSSGLDRRKLAIVRELWRWREQEAERRNCSPRRVLRDDLIVELAKRRTDDPRRIRAVRGMERGDLRRGLDDLAACVRRAAALPDEELPVQIRQDSNRQLTMLGQFLSSALTSICRDAEVAPALVGTASDVRDFLAYRLDNRRCTGQQLPVLAQGWRRELVGKLLDDLIGGRVAIRIADPAADQPLSFERLAE
jgi:ribonuclease D